ncbi:MAG TPA: ATP-binding protein [Puia sp.]|nr:ATP-binding protein [Puia sp.]
MIVLTLSFKATPAQTPSLMGYTVQHFTDENGLPQNSINDLLFDQHGYLWLATQVGLVRFNGNSFRTYYPDDRPVMESNISYLGTDPGGHLFFQTTDRHLYLYAGDQGGRLHPLNTPSTGKLLLNNRKQLFDFTAFLQQPQDPGQRLQRKAIFLDLFDHSDNFFVSDTGHIYIRHHDSLSYYDGNRLFTLMPQVPAPSQYFIAEKRLYVLKGDSVLGVYEKDRKIGGAEKIRGDGLHAATGPPAPEYRIFASGGHIHLLAGSKLYRLYPDSLRHIHSAYLTDLSFIPLISAIEYNPGLDLLLVATLTEGFYFLRKNFFANPGWPDQLRKKMSGRLFGPVALLQNEDILTDKFVFTPDGRSSTTKSPASGWRQCLFRDRAGNIWGDIGNRPVKMKTDLTPVDIGPPLDADVMDYAQDPDGKMYCLTRQSLWSMDPRSGPDPLFNRLYTTDQLPDKGDNESMAFIEPDRLWIGNTNGLIDFDIRKKDARPIQELSGMHVRAIHRCQDGSILIGTYGEGYFYYQHGHFYRMPLDKNGFLVTAHCFLEDHKGNIWIPCNKGLFRVPKADIDSWTKGETSLLFYYYYGRQDGLETNEFNGGFNPSGAITGKDFVALLSMKGIVCFYTDSLPTDFPQDSIDLSEVEIDGKPVPVKDTIDLPAGYNSLNLEVSCPYLGNRNNLYLEYSLEGLSDEWKQVPEDGMLNLSRLSPGNYTLLVRKVNGFGKNNFQYRQWSIIIPPTFYRSSGFLFALGLALLILLVLLAQVSVKLIEKKREARENAETLKGTVTRLEETVSKLQLSEQALVKTSRQREKLISLVIHDLRSPLRFLTMLATDLHDHQSGLSATELNDRTWWIKKGAQDIYHFSEDFLLWVTSQKDNFKLTKQLFLIRPLLREIHDFYLEQVLQKGNKIEYDADQNLQIYSDPHLLITIIRNLTDNANKYTDHGSIRITAEATEKGWLVTVSDTGKGMSPQQVEAFLGEGSLDNVRSGSQLGHKFVYDLTQRLGGTLLVESKEGQGTTVSLLIPASSGQIATAL